MKILNLLKTNILKTSLKHHQNVFGALALCHFGISALLMFVALLTNMRSSAQAQCGALMFEALFMFVALTMFVSSRLWARRHQPCPQPLFNHGFLVVRSLNLFSLSET